MKWTPGEIALIKAHYATLGSVALQAQYLPHKTVNLVRDRAYKLGLKYNGPRLGNGVVWSDAELAILRRLYPTGGSRAVRPLLPRRKVTVIRAKAAQLGLKSGVVTPMPEDAPWPMPTMDLLESLECVRLQKWGRPADAPRLQLFGLVGVMAMEDAA